MPSPLDAKVEALKKQALDLEFKAQALEADVLHPAYSRLDVYFGVHRPGFVVNSIHVTVDGGDGQEINYERRTAVNLIEHGIDRVARLIVPPGSHQLYTTVVGQYTDAEAKAPPVVLKSVFPFDKGTDAATLEIEVCKAPSVFRRVLRLAVGQLHDGTIRTCVRSGKGDLGLRHARFQIANQDYLSAILTLRSIRTDADGKTLPPAFDPLLAAAQSGFGLPQAAEPTYRETAAHPQDPDARAKAQLAFATQLYNHGNTAKTLDFLNAIRASLPGDFFVQWQGLRTRALLKQQHNAAAIQTLEKPDNEDDQTTYEIYNHAIALFRNGKTKDGVKQLDKVGERLRVHDSDTLALRDKANLVLGYYYLREKQANLAIHIFQRVRITGPYSNRALLGLGWAYFIASTLPASTQRVAVERAEHYNPYYSLSSIGALIRPGFLNEILDEHKRITILRRLQAGTKLSNKEYALKRALVPWSVLLSRDPMKPAVQEGMMAVPYALQQIGAHEEALTYYRKAIAALQGTRKRIAQAKRNIESNRMLETIIARDPHSQAGWNWRLTDLPDAVETFYLQRIIAEHPYQEELKNYRDLRLLGDLLDSTHTRLQAIERDHGIGPRARIPLQFLIHNTANSASSEPPSGAKSTESNRGAGVPLALSYRLNTVAPGAQAASDVSAADRPRLALAGAPSDFHGAPEQAAALSARIATLQPAIKQATKASNQRLQDIALHALDVMGKTAEHYLVEVHFAVARIYDHPSASSEVAP